MQPFDVQRVTDCWTLPETTWEWSKQSVCWNSFTVQLNRAVGKVSGQNCVTVKLISYTKCIDFNHFPLELVCFCFLWFFFPFLFLSRHGYSLRPWLWWNSLCRPGWPWTHRHLTASASQELDVKESLTTKGKRLLSSSPPEVGFSCGILLQGRSPFQLTTWIVLVLCYLRPVVLYQLLMCWQAFQNRRPATQELFRNPETSTLLGKC